MPTTGSPASSMIEPLIEPCLHIEMTMSPRRSPSASTTGSVAPSGRLIPYTPPMYPGFAALSECDPLGSARNANRPSLVVIARREPASVTTALLIPLPVAASTTWPDDDRGAACERLGARGNLRRCGGGQYQDADKEAKGSPKTRHCSSWVCGRSAIDRPDDSAGGRSSGSA